MPPSKTANNLPSLVFTAVFLPLPLRFYNDGGRLEANYREYLTVINGFARIFSCPERSQLPALASETFCHQIVAAFVGVLRAHN